jgi:proteic killer suppression protein
MIKSFNCKETKKIFNRNFSKKLPHEIQKTAFRKLRMLNRSISLNDLKVPPGNRLEKLHGSRMRQYSIRINNQWRICFEWNDNDAYNLEIVNYH